MRAVTASRPENFAIGELSRLTGVNIETIRYYERVKMLTAAPRTASGRRVYGAHDARILAFIRRARELGFAFEDIRAKISDLRKLERLLANTVARCSGAKAPECPVLEILDIRRA